MSLEFIVGVVGAVLTGAALVWGMYIRWKARRPDVVVEIKNAYPTYTGPPWVGERHLSIEVANHGPHPVRVTSIGFELPDGRTLLLLERILPDALPGTIGPHDGGSAMAPAADLARQGLDVDGRLVAFADTPLGRFRSRRSRRLGRQ
jgi:hypothetical protein